MLRQGCAAAALGALLLAGCATSTPTPGASPTPAPPLASSSAEPSTSASPHVAAPDLAVDVYRTRSDPASGRIQISVENLGGAALTVVRAELASPALPATLEREGSTVIPPGARRDLPVALTPPRCPVNDASLVATITVEQPDGSTATLSTAATDRLGQWGDWLAAECFAEAVGERVELSLERSPERDLLNGGVTARIGLTLVVAGTGSGSAALRIGALSGTPLLTPIDGGHGVSTGTDASSGVAAPDSGATARIPIDVSPARCDPHAIAEDKQGTLFPLAVSLGGEDGRVIVAASDAVRAELYAAITTACAETAGG